jgi:two-component system OmpR family response regulator
VEEAMRVFLLEDDPDTLTTIARGLAVRGYVPITASDVASARRALELQRPDAAILDLMVPGGSGYDVMELLRALDPGLPVLVLTARDAVEDRVDGLERGADDYLVKPFVFSELVARLRSIVRRPRQRVEPLRHRNLELDLLSRQARVDGRLLNLSPTEFSLLRCLVESRGEAVTRAMLLEAVWGYRFDPGTNVVDVHVSRLRKKLELARSDLALVSQRGVGYVVE